MAFTIFIRSWATSLRQRGVRGAKGNAIVTFPKAKTATHN